MLYAKEKRCHDCFSISLHLIDRPVRPTVVADKRELSQKAIQSKATKATKMP